MMGNNVFNFARKASFAFVTITYHIETFIQKKKV